MTEKLVTIFGGSGFIGRHVVRKFAAAGWRVRVAVRDTRAAMFLKPAGDLGQISLMPSSIRDDASSGRDRKVTINSDLLVGYHHPAIRADHQIVQRL